MRFLGCLLILTSLLGCTDSDMTAVISKDLPGDIKCYSGNQLIYGGGSSGAIKRVADVWEFKDSTTGKFIRVTGSCVVVN